MYSVLSRTDHTHVYVQRMSYLQVDSGSLQRDIKSLLYYYFFFCKVAFVRMNMNLFNNLLQSVNDYTI